jgi:hypothetical protein
MGQCVHIRYPTLRALVLLMLTLIGTCLIAQPFILFSDCQSPGAAGGWKRSQVTQTPTHPRSSSSSPRVPPASAKWGVLTSTTKRELGRLNGRTDAWTDENDAGCGQSALSAREGRPGQARLCSLQPCAASDNARPLARPYRVQVSSRL